LDDVHEIGGTGTLFWDDQAKAPTVHLHIACGRGNSTITGCVRRGVRVWTLLEVVLFELTDTSATRVLDPQLGFTVLQP
jgi:predicted DNA-binding protein with PD1-like motif